VNLTLNLNTSQTERALRRFQAKAPAAIARALNRSIDSGKTVMVRVLAKDMGLKQAYIRERIGTIPAKPDVRATAVLTARKKPIPLIAFNARGPEPSRGRGRGVTARNPGGAGRYPHAFIARVRYQRAGTEPGLHKGVFQRVVGANRVGPKPHRSQLPIRQLYGPSIAHVFTKNAAVGLARAQEQLPKNIRHELRFALSKAA
jgi:hypothetical protein